MDSNHSAYNATDMQNRHGSPYHGYRQVQHPADTHRYSNGGTLAPRMTSSPSPRQVRQGGMRSLQSSPRVMHVSPRIQRTGTPTSTVGRAAYSMSPPPIYSTRAYRTADLQVLDDRGLPSRDINETNIDDAFIKFILYANPSVPRDVDTGELRKAFRAPPRSDGKNFNIYALWELIRRFENKDIKTWAQLAIDLGVEPPSAEKGQSAQKIQQYAVRLKRWMKAMHVDAFFDFCNGKAHRYFMELPGGSHPADEVRDGVPLEEDLALRALMPEWRPKRGRKKNEEKHSDAEPPAKRPHLEPHSAIEYTGLGVHGAFPESAVQWSALPDEMHHDAWTLPSALPHGPLAQQGPHSAIFQARGFEYPRYRRDLSPSSYPQSALTLSRPPDNEVDEPRSAVLPSGSKSKARRKHGPNVSSAWSSRSGASGKPRGRPPASKQEDPPSALPPDKDLPAQSQPHPSIEHSTPPTITEINPTPTRRVPAVSSRPNKLQLQVPERLGGPIRLATPDGIPHPVVLVNGDGRLRRNSIDYFRNPEGSDMDDHDAEGDHEPDHHASRSTGPHTSNPPSNPAIPTFSLADVTLSFASRLLSTKIIGRPTALSPLEAHALATKAVLCILGPRPVAPSAALALKCALILGVEARMGIGSARAVEEPHVGVRAVRQVLDSSGRRRRAGTAETGGGLGQEQGAYSYTVSIDGAEEGGFSSSVTLRDLVVPVEDGEDEGRMDELKDFVAGLLAEGMEGLDGEAEGDEEKGDRGWKERFLEGRREARVVEEKFRRLKRVMFEVLMA